jgi:acyl-CoA thioesterase-1
MRRWCLALSLLICLAPATAAARTILVLGDSLGAAFGIETGAGWVTLLEQRLARQNFSYRVVNASISGDTSAGGLARLPALLSTHRPDIVIVELGGNDGLRGLPPQQMKDNLIAMVGKARAGGAKVLLLGLRMPPNYGKRYTEMFQQVYRDVAAEQGIPLVPFILEGIADRRDLMQRDGIHPTAAAQSRLLENVWPALRPLL